MRPDAGMRAALVRHPTPEVAAGLCYGRLDVGLAPAAAAQTRALIDRLRGWRGARVWSSPRRRCRLPAEAIAQALGAAPVSTDERLGEMDFGAWEGRPWQSIPRVALDAWAGAAGAFRPPGGESGRELIRRVSDFWRALPAGRHIVVTHGGPLKVLTALAAGAPVDLLRPPPGWAEIVEVSRPGCRTGGVMPPGP